MNTVILVLNAITLVLSAGCTLDNARANNWSAARGWFVAAIMSASAMMSRIV